MQKILLGTNNPGKLAEVRTFAANFDAQVLSPADLNINIEVEETGETFQENAELKARAFAEAAQDPDLWVLGDDSGVTIDALNGEPGVHTRRWADRNREMTDQELLDYTLERLKGVTYEDRTAQLISAMALVKAGAEPVLFESSVEGIILEAPSSKASYRQGFPFRQIFYVTENQKMLGQLEDSPGDVLTHRQQTFKKVLDYILAPPVDNAS